MLSSYDDLPIHQTADPIAMPATSDRDFYERYWFNGYTTDGGLFFGAAMGIYPHLGIIDGAISVIHDGVQHAFHVSGRATGERGTTAIGPYRVEIDRPMQTLRLVLDSNDTTFSADLHFEGRTACIEEPRHDIRVGNRRMMDTTRFTQLGRWSGTLRFDGTTIELDRATTLGTKDRSWGWRPVGGGDHRGAPPLSWDGGIFFLWAPLHWDDHCTHFQLFEDRHGRTLHSVGAILPVYDSVDDLPGIEDGGVEHLRLLDHRLTMAPGSRQIREATLSASRATGERVEIELDILATFRMKGIGYSHPEWGHGAWKGELATAEESWKLADVDDTDFFNQHVQHIVRARCGDDTSGVGVLEQNIFGPYAPLGLTGLIDPPSSA